MTLRYRQLVKRVINVFVILIYSILQMTSPLTDAVMWSAVAVRAASLQHDRLLQLINGDKLPAVVYSLLHGLPYGVMHPI